MTETGPCTASRACPGVLAACRHDQTVGLANNYGLLTVTVARKPEQSPNATPVRNP